MLFSTGLRCPVSAAFNDTAKYKVNCNSGEDTATKTYSIHTTCTFSCRDKYYQHDGSKRRTCLHSEKWSGKFIDCRGEVSAFIRIKGPGYTRSNPNGSIPKL